MRFLKKNYFGKNRKKSCKKKINGKEIEDKIEEDRRRWFEYKKMATISKTRQSRRKLKSYQDMAGRNERSDRKKRSKIFRTGKN